jgi:hypothetical protein
VPWSTGISSGPSKGCTGWSATSASWRYRTACTRCWPRGSTPWTRACGGGLYHALGERRRQAIAYLREGARLATEAGDNFTLGRALLNLADALTPIDPAAIASLRQQSTPYHLAHGLLDHAEHLLSHGDAEAAATAVGEARGIAGRPRCQPLLDRAAALSPEESPALTLQESPAAGS